MILRDDADLRDTRVKRRELKDLYARRVEDNTAHARVRELTLLSLKRLINQLTEEIVRYETRQPTR
jgi:hypothetical protein